MTAGGEIDGSVAGNVEADGSLDEDGEAEASLE